jgi:putative Holliday junction resolvase
VAVFERNESLMDELYELIAKYNTKLIVVGLPRNLKGEAGPQAQKVLFFVEDLKRTFKELEVVLWDERYTSIIAHKIFKNINISGKRERKMKDSMEAVVILESYIEYIRRHRRNEE